MGSVKDLRIIELAYENRVGYGIFTFSNRFSIHDYGKMPDPILNKGEALAVMSAYNFELLEKGIRTHYKGIVNQGSLLKFSDLKIRKGGLNKLGIDLALVYHPTERSFIDEEGNKKTQYDYSFFDNNRGEINNYLLGLEIIFRNGLPKGSSVFKRIENAEKIENQIEREKELSLIYKELGIKSKPKPGDMLPKPIINFTTKLEAGDRNLSEDEAYKISGLSEEEFTKIKPLALLVDEIITERAKIAGFAHFDGKIEMVFNSGLVICDVIGTFDEDRFGFNNRQISKEILRQWYDKNQPEFRKACEKWKVTGEGWQDRCDVKPIKLLSRLSSLVSFMYMAGCNRYVRKEIFNAPDLEKVMEELEIYLGV